MIYYKQESYDIIGAAFEVYNKLGHGFLEAVYQECLEIEFKKRGIPYEREKDIKIFYDGIELTQSYRADFVCYDKIIVELKAVSALDDAHHAQVYNYLHATGDEVLVPKESSCLIPAAIADYDLIPVHGTAKIMEAFINNKKSIGKIVKDFLKFKVYS